jgi:hypothetical protein
MTRKLHGLLSLLIFQRISDAYAYASSSSAMSAAFTHSLTCHRKITFPPPLDLTPPALSSSKLVLLDQCLQHCLTGWRRDNLGLPWYIPKPILSHPGHPTTGIGLILIRIPPLGLQEGIVNVVWNTDDTTNIQPSSVTVVYQVLNPGWLTFPVHEHVGYIRFVVEDDDDRRGDDDNNAKNINPRQQFVRLEWTVQWTPLVLPLKTLQTAWDGLVESAIRAVIERASEYMGMVGIPMAAAAAATETVEECQAPIG